MRAVQRIFFTMGLVVSGMCAAAEEAVELEGISIHGNRELPKSLVIVPWKTSEQGELGHPSVDSLMDDVVTPVDRDVFRRELNYYEAVHAAE